MRKRFPTAYELAYDNYNFFALGYGPTERPSDCIVSMAVGANGRGKLIIRSVSAKQRPRLRVDRPPHGLPGTSAMRGCR